MLKFQFEPRADCYWSRRTNPAATYREIFHHAFLPYFIGIFGPTWPKPDRERDFDTLEAAAGIGRAAAEECSKAIGAELAPKRINRQTAQENIRKRFSGRGPDFARSAGRTAEIGHRTFQNKGFTDCTERDSRLQRRGYAYHVLPT